MPVSGGREFIATVSADLFRPRESGERRAIRSTFLSTDDLCGTRRSRADLLEGYRSVLPHGVYPVAFLFVDIPLEEIDVNVHPAKTEIRFRRDRGRKGRDRRSRPRRARLSRYCRRNACSGNESPLAKLLRLASRNYFADRFEQVPIEFPVEEQLIHELTKAEAEIESSVPVEH